MNGWYESSTNENNIVLHRGQFRATVGPTKTNRWFWVLYAGDSFIDKGFTDKDRTAMRQAEEAMSKHTPLEGPEDEDTIPPF